MERVQRMSSRGGGGGGSGGGGGGGGTMFADNNNSYSRPKFGTLLYSDPGFSSTSTTGFSSTSTEDDYSNRNSSVSVMSADSSPYSMSPWNQTSPYSKSPWQRNSPVTPLYEEDSPPNCLIGSLVREEGHIYSLAACDDLLYTGSDSKNIRVWKKQKEFSGFKSTSGLVKAIVISGEKIFTGHQDGKIRIWKVSNKHPNVHKRIGSLPKFKDFVKKSMKPSNYVEVSRKKNALWIKHFDAISCLSLNEDQGLLYSGSWDKTLKVWRIADSKCLESINAHDDAVNSVVSGFDGLVFTGSADGTVKVWRRELQGKKTKHLWLQTLLKQECAVTALAVNPSGTVVYSGSSDGVVNFWEREMHLKHGGELRGHKQAVLCLATAGDLVFTGSADKTICVWRRERTGLHINVSILTGHSGPVKCLAVGKEYGEDDDLSKRSDGGGKGAWILYSGSLDKSVKVWKVSEKSRDIQKLASLKQPKDELLDTPDEDLSPTEQHPPLMFRKW